LKVSANSKVILVIPAGLLVLSLGALVTAVWQFESISALLEQTHWTLGFTQSMDPIQAAPGWEEPEPAADGLNSAEKNPEHCTVFYASNDKVALGGNNEDALNPRTKIWFLPPEDGNYGVAFVGYEDLYPQGGVNDHGLFFDGLAVRVVTVPREVGKPVYNGYLMVKAMQECATVECALKLFDQFSRGPGTWNGQFLIGDSTGDSAIIEPLAVIRKQGKYQVATNFFQSEVKSENRTDTRYKIATEMFKNAEVLSVDFFREVLNATHQAGAAHTLYSTIYDLRRGLIYLYFFHDFDRVVVFDLKTELAKGIHAYDIPLLFPPSADALAFGRWISDDMTMRQIALSRVAVNPMVLESYTGKYEFTPVQHVLIKSEGDKLFGRTLAMPWVELVPQSQIQFSQLFSDAMGNVRRVEVTFLRDIFGEVIGLEFADGMGNQSVARKLEQQASPTIWIGSFAAVVILAIPVVWYARGKRKGC
jgi:hypothetical protein